MGESHLEKHLWKKNTSIPTNPEIEKFSYWRENLHKSFRMDFPTVRRLLVLGVGVPFGIFYFYKTQLIKRNSDKLLERPDSHRNKYFGS